MRNGETERAGGDISGKKSKMGLDCGVLAQIFCIKDHWCFLCPVSETKVKAGTGTHQGVDKSDWRRPGFKIKPCQQV